MYNGQVNVAQESLNSFLKSAESLKIRGLTENEAISKEPNKDAVVSPPAKRKRSNQEKALPVTPEPSKAPSNVIAKIHDPPPLKQEVVELSNDEEGAEDYQSYGDQQSGALVVPAEEEEELLEIPEDRPQGGSFSLSFSRQSGLVCELTS